MYAKKSESWSCLNFGKKGKYVKNQKQHRQSDQFKNWFINLLILWRLPFVQLVIYLNSQLTVFDARSWSYSSCADELSLNKFDFKCLNIIANWQKVENYQWAPKTKWNENKIDFIFRFYFSTTDSFMALAVLCILKRVMME